MATLTLKADARREVIAKLGLAELSQPTSPPASSPPTSATPQVSPYQARRKRWKAAKKFWQRLSAECPAAFAAFDHGPRVALAIGIHRQLAERYADVPIKTRGLLLQEYTSAVLYLRLLTAGAPRVGLDGSVTGHVTEVEADHAAERLRRRTAAPTEQHPVQQLTAGGNTP